MSGFHVSVRCSLDGAHDENMSPVSPGSEQPAQVSDIIAVDELVENKSPPGTDAHGTYVNSSSNAVLPQALHSLYTAMQRRCRNRLRQAHALEQAENSQLNDKRMMELRMQKLANEQNLVILQLQHEVCLERERLKHMQRCIDELECFHRGANHGTESHIAKEQDEAPTIPATRKTKRPRWDATKVSFHMLDSQTQGRGQENTASPAHIAPSMRAMGDEDDVANRVSWL